jgi:molecular chaperone GrpE
MKENEEVLENTPETLEQLVNEVNDYKDKYYRAVAESENIKKRVERDKTQAIKFANEKFARDLLEILDDFENCLKVEMDDDIRTGIELIYRGLLKTLEKNKVKECVYETFDPQIHEAISSVDSDQESNTIVEIFRKGYMIEDKLLRPAMVSVSR